MFQSSGSKGADLINRATGVFKLIADDLTTGIAHCKDEIEKHQTIVKESENRIDEMHAHIGRAEKVANGLKLLAA